MTSLDIEPLVAELVARLAPMLAPPREAPVSKRAYRVPAVAELLSLSESEVRLLVAQGSLGSIRVGRVVLVPSQAIDDFVAAKLGEARQP
jgi:excisionase family DNA binding protein